MGSDVRTREITTRSGVRVHAHEGGVGTPLLLVHGQLCDHAVWGPTVEHLAGRRSVATMDLPAHGASAAPRTMAIEEFGRAVLEAIHALGWPRAAAVGHSLGATALVHAARAEPDVFAGLMLVALPPGEVPERKRRLFHAIADEINDAIPARFDPLAAELWYSPAHRASHPELLASLRRRLDGNDPALARDVLRAVADQPPLRPEAPLAMPTIVVAMDEDAATPLDTSRALIEALGAEVVHLPGGHFPFEEVPGAFFRCLDELLVSCP